MEVFLFCLRLWGYLFLQQVFQTFRDEVTIYVTWLFVFYTASDFFFFSGDFAVIS